MASQCQKHLPQRSHNVKVSSWEHTGQTDDGQERVWNHTNTTCGTTDTITPHCLSITCTISTQVYSSILNELFFKAADRIREIQSKIKVSYNNAEMPCFRHHLTEVSRSNES